MEKCIACDSGITHKQGAQAGYIEGAFYEIIVCEMCDTSWASPHIAGDTVYDLIYKNRKDAPGYMRYYVYAKDILKKKNPLQYLAQQEEMYYGLTKALKGRTSHLSRILDVGCGLGYVTYALHQAGYDATGLDISSRAIEEAKRNYGDYFVCEDFFRHTPKDDVKYDVICMLELIEHVDDPARYISHAMSLLSSRGILILTTPNKSFYPKGSLWETDAPPVHITWFSELGISKLSSRLGLTASFIPFTSYNLIHGTVRKSFPNIGATRTAIFSKTGEPLYSRYSKSSLRVLTEKYHIYALLKGVSKLKNKIIDVAKLAIHPSLFTGAKSNIICTVISRAE